MVTALRAAFSVQSESFVISDLAPSPKAQMITELGAVCLRYQSTGNPLGGYRRSPAYESLILTLWIGVV
jgi:hypothetical protein